MRYQELENKFLKEGLSDDELKEYQELLIEENKKKRGRKDTIKKLIEDIKNNNVAILELFTIEEVKAVLPASRSQKTTTRTTTERPSKSAATLLKIETGSRPKIYNQGRIFEDAKGQVRGENVKPWVTLPGVFEGLKTEQEVLSVATDEGKKYFSTTEGKEELKEIIKVLND